jgi:Protein of unknown function (DUF1592)/Protein of unknown function (DUF1588)/Protein of unknown function (DUF1595)
MRYLRTHSQPRRLGAAVVTLAFAAGCSGSISSPSEGAILGTPTAPGANQMVPGASTTPGSPQSSGSVAPVPGASGTSTTIGTTPVPDASSMPPATTCSGELVTDAKRIVRLSFNQLSRTYHALLGEELGAALDAEYQIGVDSQVARTFPPLSSPQEGSTINTGIWQKIDLMAQFASAYTAENLAEISGCGAQATDECGRSFIGSFAEKAYRRPLLADELSSLLKVYDEIKADNGTTLEAIENTVSAVLQSPQLLYRTELGTSKDVAGPLTPHELASSLAYFLSDAPPDADLLTAAEQNQLTTPEQIRAQVDRLLATPAVRKNLEGAMFSYFQIDTLAGVKIDDPAFTNGTEARPFTGVRESAYHEVELFLEHVLWNEPLNALLTSEKSFINSTLAPLYGVTLNGAGGDEATFVETALPENRAGLLTQVGFLASNSRPDVPSVVARGLVVNKSMLCQSNPSFPEGEALTDLIEEAALELATATERERSHYRVTVQPCLSCHAVFDAYGLALDNYDIIGRYRTMDPQGRPIDPSVTLPPLFDNATAMNVVEMQRKIADHPAFNACFSKNMLNWALAEGSQLGPTSCSARGIADAFANTDKTFSALLREVATSAAFTNRNAGVTP